MAEIKSIHNWVGTYRSNREKYPKARHWRERMVGSPESFRYIITVKDNEEPIDIDVTNEVGNFFWLKDNPFWMFDAQEAHFEKIYNKMYK